MAMPQRQVFARRTKIVCTIGSGSRSSTLIERLIRPGMNVAQLNLSHGTPHAHAQVMVTVRRVVQRLAVPVAVLMDLPIIAKIERGQAISHIEEILLTSDGIMVA